MNQKKTTRFVTRAGVIAALYFVLTLISSLVGLSSGVIQCRLSEALSVLAAFLPEAIPGLFIGCIIANIFALGAIWDIIFGSIATLIGAIGAYYIGRLGHKFRFLVPLPTVLANTLIVPFILIYAYGATEAYPFLLFTVGIGEVISAWVLGLLLYTAILPYADKLRL